MHTIHYEAPEATVFGWADPITGYVWETVYDRTTGQNGTPMVAVHTEAQTDWSPYDHPNYFAGRHVGDHPALPHISVRGERIYGAKYMALHLGSVDLIDY